MLLIYYTIHRNKAGGADRPLVFSGRRLFMSSGFKLFLTFSRISASCFGGGYAMLPFFQQELVEKRGWLTDEELLDLNAVAQCTPGVISVNTATFCGYRVGGIRGAVSATLGILFPPVVIVLLISAFFWQFAENPCVRHALVGVRACVCALILNSTIKLYQKAVLDLTTFLIFAAVFVLSALVGLSPALLVLAAGGLGLALHAVRHRMQKEDET